MRQQDKVIIWPAYFDAAKSRKNGRKVPKNIAVSVPKAMEIKEAADKLHLKAELLLETSYPKTPWVKTGMVLVEKTEPKSRIVLKIAKQLQKNRSATLPKA
ncbi:MAG: signal recognition particle subunit SRP19/SEC65 family protein [Candidatus Bathyarchaeia archaeon]